MLHSLALAFALAVRTRWFRLHRLHRRFRLASLLDVRVQSKLKFEFELFCSSRSFRLRAPSAQALALWVTAISNEWMNAQQAPSPP